MTHYIIQDAYTGYIWGDTRDFNGEVYAADGILDACRKLDEIIGGADDREYEEVSRLDGDCGYAVYRVDINGSEAVAVVHDGQDQEYIKSVQNDCDLVGFVQWSEEGE